MIINSIKPTKIPDCTIWLDFSDESSLQLDSENDLANFVLAVDKINGNTFSTTIGFTSPVYKKSAINNKGALYFGSDMSHVTSGAYSDCISQASFLTENNGFETINDSERTIFMVYETLDTTYISGTRSSVTLTHPTFGWTNLTPGTYGCILNIPVVDFYYLDSNENSNDWTTWEVSDINLLRYKGDATYSYCNYLNVQGFTNSGGTNIPINDTSKRFSIADKANTPSLFFLSSKDHSNELVYINYEPWFSTVASSNTRLTYQNSGTFLSSSYEPRKTLSNIYLGNTGDKTYNQKYGFCGYIGEFIYYSRKLNDKEVKQIKSYLIRKWGI